jgi:hypothetical protein
LHRHDPAPRAGGTLGTATDLSPAFGGGLASQLSRTTGDAEQNSFLGRLLPRPDGSYLAVGGLSVVHHTGEGAGFSAGFVAVAAYTPLLALDMTFGGPQQAPAAQMRPAPARGLGRPPGARARARDDVRPGPRRAARARRSSGGSSPRSSRPRTRPARRTS